MKILLVEDDDAVRNTLLDVLKHQEHTVVGANSAEDALSKLPGDYNLVISDVLLRDMDGLSLLDKVNRMEPRIPVVMITGFGGVEIEETCRRRGAAGFLNKPFSVHRLLSLVDEVEKRVH